MKLQIDGKTYPVIIDKKKTTKNLYIRIKEDLTVYITCHSTTSDKQIEKIIKENSSSIRKMIERTKKKQQYQQEFYFLGN